MGCHVKMWWAPHRRWYFGTIIEIQSTGPLHEDDGDDDVPLSVIAEENRPLSEFRKAANLTDMDVDEDGDDSDNDPNYIPSGEESEEDNSQIVGCGDVAMRPCLSQPEDRITIPEDFVVDGSSQKDGAGDSRRVQI